jgi:D-glycero-alpha-D-manno-heptose-7-phosphate kinase
MFKPGFLLKYSELERVDSIEEIRHTIIKAVMKEYMPDESGIELVSTADIPSGTGLGSSGSFTTALLRAVYGFNRKVITPGDLAEQACYIEIEKLREPIGKQDQYIAAFGGITCFEIDKDGTVEATPLHLEKETRYELEDNLLLFFTGYSRDASSVLKIQDDRTKSNDSDMVQNLHFIKQLGMESKIALEKGDVNTFGELMNVHWEHKKKRAAAMSSEHIDELYEIALKNGAVGGKLIGAGGGGFLMFYAHDKRMLRQTMKKEGLEEMRFRFDFSGTRNVSV